MTDQTITPDQARYQRQMQYEPIGATGQRKLSQARVLLVGCGALGTVLAETLVRAGVGHLKIVDRDFIELNNLQRQVLFDEDDLHAALPKSIAAARKLQRINSQVTIEAEVVDVNHTNIERLAGVSGADALVGTMRPSQTTEERIGITTRYDLLLDGTDNFETRYLLNDVSIKYGIPWIYGACVAAQGLAMVIRPEVSPCLRCVFETMPPAGMSPTCDTAGIIAPAVQIVASWQAAEALKLLTGNHVAVSPYLLSFDLWQNRFQQIDMSKARNAADCPVCRQGRYEFLSGQGGSATTTLCGRNAVQVSPPPMSAGTSGAVSAEHPKLDLARLAESLRASGTVTYNAFLLKCQLRENSCEITLFPDGRAIIKGTNDPAVARALYARYIGH
ncbi:MAG: ThiF family adenylyltransferase [Phycisphaerae bacterium]